MNSEITKDMIVVVRVRGDVRLNDDIRSTFKHLNLHNKNWCILLKNTPSNLGMVQKVKDYVTWGEATEEMVKQIIEKRGEAFDGRLEDSKSGITYNKYFEIGGKKYKRYFRLSPPVKGYGRNGIKASFVSGGSLGYRADKINDLLQRML